MNTAPCENVHDEEQRSKYYYVVFPSAFFYYRQNNNLHLRGHISHMDTKNKYIFYGRQRKHFTTGIDTYLKMIYSNVVQLLIFFKAIRIMFVLRKMFIILF